MARILEQPAPLREPIGIGQILFTRRSAPLTRYFVEWRVGWWTAFSCAVLLVGFFWFVATQDHGLMRSSRRFREFLLVTTIIALPLSESGAFLLVPFAVTMIVLGWQRQHRIYELVLTLERPVTFGQLMLVRVPLGVGVFVITTGLGLIVFAAWNIVMRDFPFTDILTPLLIGVAVANAIISVYCYGWVWLTLLLHLKLFKALVAYVLFAIVFSITSAPLWIVVYGLLMLGIESNFIAPRYDEEVLLMAAFVLTALMWIVKYYWAKAYAARLEQVVFPSMEF
ncbi:hypothetical protein ACFL34_04220 [Candidatus Sumerlaeota bacterium]